MIFLSFTQVFSGGTPFEDVVEATAKLVNDLKDLGLDIAEGIFDTIEYGVVTLVDNIAELISKGACYIHVQGFGAETSESIACGDFKLSFGFPAEFHTPSSINFCSTINYLFMFGLFMESPVCLDSFFSNCLTIGELRDLCSVSDTTGQLTYGDIPCNFILEEDTAVYECNGVEYHMKVPEKEYITTFVNLQNNDKKILLKKKDKNFCKMTTYISDLNNAPDIFVPVYKEKDFTSYNGFLSLNNCLYNWAVGEWSSCSAPNCDSSGTAKRDVVCKREDGLNVGDLYCSGNKPVEKVNCNLMCDVNLNYPVLFIHGHSTFDLPSNPSYIGKEDFKEMINYLIDENEKFYHAGHLIGEKVYRNNNLINNFPSDKTGLFTTTYYDFGRNNQGISYYSQRLDFKVRKILELTGKDKILLVGHSMGGLVIRKYLDNYGKDKIYKYISIGTPHKGISNLAYSICKESKRKDITIECDQMKMESSFLSNIDKMSYDEYPDRTVTLGGTYSGTSLDMGSIEIYNIGRSDGVVNLGHTNIDIISNNYIYYDEGELSQEVFEDILNGGSSLHTDLLIPSKIEEISQIIYDTIIN